MTNAVTLFLLILLLSYDSTAQENLVVEGNSTIKNYLNVNNTNANVATALFGGNSATQSFSRGILGLVNGTTDFGIGVEGQALGSSGQQWGVYGYSYGSEDIIRVGTGGLAAGTGATAAQYGIYGWILGESAATRVAVFGYPGGTGTGTQYAGYFVGDVTVTGTFDNPSDIKFKKNLRQMDNQLERIKALNPVLYEMNTEDFPEMNFTQGEKVGFIAQEVEAVFPELVKDNAQAIHQNRLPHMDLDSPQRSKGSHAKGEIKYKGLNSIGMIPILTKGIQEIIEIVESKDKEVAELREELTKQAQEVAELRAKLDKLSEDKK